MQQSKDKDVEFITPHPFVPHVIETELPDGVYWFAGMLPQKIGNTIGYFESWMPYFTDALVMSEDDANEMLKVLKSEGHRVVTVDKARHSEQGFMIHELSSHMNEMIVGRPKRICDLKEGMYFRFRKDSANYIVTRIEKGKLFYVLLSQYGKNKSSFMRWARKQFVCAIIDTDSVKILDNLKNKKYVKNETSG